jgi:hypothetical protein
MLKASTVVSTGLKVLLAECMHASEPISASRDVLMAYGLLTAQQMCPGLYLDRRRLILLFSHEWLFIIILVIELATSMTTDPAPEIDLDRSLVSRAHVSIYDTARLKGFQAASILGSAAVAVLCTPFDHLSPVEQHKKVGNGSSTQLT